VPQALFNSHVAVGGVAGDHERAVGRRDLESVRGLDVAVIDNECLDANVLVRQHETVVDLGDGSEVSMPVLDHAGARIEQVGFAAADDRDAGSRGARLVGHRRAGP
jgi:hypothetical protein